MVLLVSVVCAFVVFMICLLPSECAEIDSNNDMCSKKMCQEASNPFDITRNDAVNGLKNAAAYETNPGDMFRDISGNPNIKKVSEVHDNGFYTSLCWIEITTITETKNGSKSAIREYAITFETPSDIPKKYISNKTKLADGETIQYKIFDRDTKKSEVVNFTTVSRSKDSIVRQNRKVLCGSGPVYTKEFMEWPHSDRKRVEIRVSPKKQSLVATDCVVLNATVESISTLSPTRRDFDGGLHEPLTSEGSEEKDAVKSNTQKIPITTIKSIENESTGPIKELKENERPEFESIETTIPAITSSVSKALPVENATESDEEGENLEPGVSKLSKDILPTNTIFKQQTKNLGSEFTAHTTVTSFQPIVRNTTRGNVENKEQDAGTMVMMNFQSTHRDNQKKPFLELNTIKLTPTNEVTPVSNNQDATQESTKILQDNTPTEIVPGTSDTISSDKNKHIEPQDFKATESEQSTTELSTKLSSKYVDVAEQSDKEFFPEKQKPEKGSSVPTQIQHLSTTDSSVVEEKKGTSVPQILTADNDVSYMPIGLNAIFSETPLSSTSPNKSKSLVPTTEYPKFVKYSDTDLSVTLEDTGSQLTTLLRDDYTLTTENPIINTDKTKHKVPETLSKDITFNTVSTPETKRLKSGNISLFKFITKPGTRNYTEMFDKVTRNLPASTERKAESKPTETYSESSRFDRTDQGSTINKDYTGNVYENKIKSYSPKVDWEILPSSTPVSTRHAITGVVSQSFKYGDSVDSVTLPQSYTKDIVDEAGYITKIPDTSFSLLNTHFTNDILENLSEQPKSTSKYIIYGPEQTVETLPELPRESYTEGATASKNLLDQTAQNFEILKSGIVLAKSSQKPVDYMITGINLPGEIKSSIADIGFEPGRITNTFSHLTGKYTTVSENLLDETVNTIKDVEISRSGIMPTGFSLSGRPIDRNNRPENVASSESLLHQPTEQTLKSEQQTDILSNLSHRYTRSSTTASDVLLDRTRNMTKVLSTSEPMKTNTASQALDDPIITQSSSDIVSPESLLHRSKSTPKQIAIKSEETVPSFPPTDRISPASYDILDETQMPEKGFKRPMPIKTKMPSTPVSNDIISPGSPLEHSKGTLGQKKQLMGLLLITSAATPESVSGKSQITIKHRAPLRNVTHTTENGLEKPTHVKPQPLSKLSSGNIIAPESKLQKFKTTKINFVEQNENTPSADAYIAMRVTPPDQFPRTSIHTKNLLDENLTTKDLEKFSKIPPEPISNYINVPGSTIDYPNSKHSVNLYFTTALQNLLNKSPNPTEYIFIKPSQKGYSIKPFEFPSVAYFTGGFTSPKKMLDQFGKSTTSFGYPNDFSTGDLTVSTPESLLLNQHQTMAKDIRPLQKVYSELPSEYLDVMFSTKVFNPLQKSLNQYHGTTKHPEKPYVELLSKYSSVGDFTSSDRLVDVNQRTTPLTKSEDKVYSKVPAKHPYGTSVREGVTSSNALLDQHQSTIEYKDKDYSELPSKPFSIEYSTSSERLLDVTQRKTTRTDPEQKAYSRVPAKHTYDTSSTKGVASSDELLDQYQSTTNQAEKVYSELLSKYPSVGNFTSSERLLAVNVKTTSLTKPEQKAHSPVHVKHTYDNSFTKGVTSTNPLLAQYQSTIKHAEKSHSDLPRKYSSEEYYISSERLLDVMQRTTSPIKSTNDSLSESTTIPEQPRRKPFSGGTLKYSSDTASSEDFTSSVRMLDFFQSTTERVKSKYPTVTSSTSDVTSKQLLLNEFQKTSQRPKQQSTVSLQEPYKYPSASFVTQNPIYPETLVSQFQGTTISKLGQQTYSEVNRSTNGFAPLKKLLKRLQITTVPVEKGDKSHSTVQFGHPNKTYSTGSFIPFKTENTKKPKSGLIYPSDQYSTSGLTIPSSLLSHSQSTFKNLYFPKSDYMTTKKFSVPHFKHPYEDKQSSTIVPQRDNSPDKLDDVDKSTDSTKVTDFELSGISSTTESTDLSTGSVIDILKKLDNQLCNNTKQKVRVRVKILMEHILEQNESGKIQQQIIPIMGIEKKTEFDIKPKWTLPIISHKKLNRDWNTFLDDLAKNFFYFNKRAIPDYTELKPTNLNLNVPGYGFNGNILSPRETIQRMQGIRNVIGRCKHKHSLKPLGGRKSIAELAFTEKPTASRNKHAIDNANVNNLEKLRLTTESQENVSDFYRFLLGSSTENPEIEAENNPTKVELPSKYILPDNEQSKIKDLEVQNDWNRKPSVIFRSMKYMTPIPGSYRAGYEQFSLSDLFPKSNVERSKYIPTIVYRIPPKIVPEIFRRDSSLNDYEDYNILSRLSSSNSPQESFDIASRIGEVERGVISHAKYATPTAAPSSYSFKNDDLSPKIATVKTFKHKSKANNDSSKKTQMKIMKPVSRSTNNNNNQILNSTMIKLSNNVTQENKYSTTPKSRNLISRRIAKDHGHQLNGNVNTKPITENFKSEQSTHHRILDFKSILDGIINKLNTLLEKLSNR